MKDVRTREIRLPEASFDFDLLIVGTARAWLMASLAPKVILSSNDGRSWHWVTRGRGGSVVVSPSWLTVGDKSASSTGSAPT